MSYSFDFINFYFCWVLNILFVQIHMPKIFIASLSELFCQGITVGRGQKDQQKL